MTEMTMVDGGDMGNQKQPIVYKGSLTMSQRAMRIVRAEIDGTPAAPELGTINRSYRHDAAVVWKYGTPAEIHACTVEGKGVRAVSDNIRARKTLGKPKHRVHVAVSAREKALHRGQQMRHKGSLEEVARQAASLREGGMPIDVVAKTVGVSKDLVWKMIDIVLLADRSDLSVKDTNIVKFAMEQMCDRSQTIGYAHNSIRAIGERIWGGQHEGGGARSGRKGREKQRLDHFRHHLTVLVQVCINAREVEVPYLPKEMASQMLVEMKQAVTALEKLTDMIRSIHK